MAMDQQCLQRRWRSSCRTAREDENMNNGNGWMNICEEEDDRENPVEENERSEEEELQVQAFGTASVSTDDIGDSEKDSTFRGLTCRDEEQQMTDSSDEYDGHCSFEDFDDCDMYPKKLYSDPAYPGVVFEALENMMLFSVLTDLTIYTEDGHHFQVHSIVLAAVSNLIQLRLRQNPRQEQIITLCLGPEVHGSGLAAVVEFAYTGNISILNKANMELVRTAAVSLEAPRVLELCREEEQREQDKAIGKKEGRKCFSAEEHMNDNLQRIRQLWTQRVGCDVELEAEGRVFNLHMTLVSCLHSVHLGSI